VSVSGASVAHAYCRPLFAVHTACRPISVFIEQPTNICKCCKNHINIKVKGEVTLVRGRGGPWGCETSRLSYLIDNRLTDGGKVVSLSRWSPFNPRKIPGAHFRSNPTQGMDVCVRLFCVCDVLCLDSVLAAG
jgi:hypothetical protein